MSKIFLQDSFKEFCKINKLEVNTQQVKIINSLEKFLDNKETILKAISSDKKHLEGLFFPDSYYFYKNTSDIEPVSYTHLTLPTKA